MTRMGPIITLSTKESLLFRLFSSFPDFNRGIFLADNLLQYSHGENSMKKFYFCLMSLFLLLPVGTAANLFLPHCPKKCKKTAPLSAGPFCQGTLL